MPLLLALRGVGARRGLLLGLVAGFGFFGVLLYWISYFGYLAWGALVLLQGAFFAAFGAVAARWSRFGQGARLAGLPILWAGLEIARGRWPWGGFSWGDLGYSQIDEGALAHLARWAGVFGVSAAVVAINALIAEVLQSKSRVRSMGFIASAAALAFLPAVISLNVEARERLDVAAVQGNAPRGHFAGIGRAGPRTGPEDFVVRDNHVRVTEQLVGDPPDLIVWPENSLDRDPRGNDFFEPVADVVRRVGAPLIAGAILDAGDHFRNSNIFVDKSGEIDPSRYDKVHLVPFGEYVPWRWVRRVVPALDREIPLDGRRGNEPTVFPVTPVLFPNPQTGPSVGTLICFESTYPELARGVVQEGADVLVITTNNASFGTSPAARQHLQMSRMRAIENGRPLVHVAVAGISAIVGADGSIQQEAGLFRSALLRRDVAVTGRARPSNGPYTRVGGQFELSLVIVAALMALATIARGRAQ